MLVSSELENLIAYYHEKKLAHAYLISTNNVQKCHEVLINVIKNIFCIQEFEENCSKCSLCHLIDLNNLPSLKIIDSDGSLIKKDQILELRSLFSKASLYTKESIYIIKNAEKMNKESANTMLKFLEEPEGNIIGFFITTHEDSVLPTIKSRCQQIELLFENNLYEKYQLQPDEYEKSLTLLTNYLSKIEIERKKLILYNREYFNAVEKEEIKSLFQIMLDIYQAKLNNKIGIEESNFDFNFLDNLSFTNINKKINLIIKCLNDLNYNVNIDLLLDKFVIEMENINNAVV